MNRNTIAILALAVLTPPTLAQSNISPINKYAWGENIGFLNFRDANGAAEGVVVHFSYLTGRVWLENAGWLTLGGGPLVPTTGCAFAGHPAPDAQSGSAYGVNLNGDLLEGYAWGENIGWVNFSGGALATPPKPARFDRVAKRFRGYAWGENVGWINLDGERQNPPEPPIFVGTLNCPADADDNGAIQPADISLFVNVWFCSLSTATRAGDFDGNGALEPADVAAFVTAWFNAL